MTSKLLALAFAAAILAVGTGGVAAAPDAGTDTDASATDDPVHIDLEDWDIEHDDDGEEYDQKLTADESITLDFEEEEVTRQGDGIYVVDYDDEE